LNFVYLSIDVEVKILNRQSAKTPRNIFTNSPKRTGQAQSLLSVDVEVKILNRKVANVASRKNVEKSPL
jgi:hypothetical protein